YLFAEKFEKRVKEIKNDNSRFNDQQARAKTRNIYKLFGESYDPEPKTVVKGLGIEKIERIQSYSADYISKLNATQIY
ncbi:3435_t:CDS:2, partial [Scutellospora calospora]